MEKRRISAAGGLLAVVLVLVAIGVTAGSSGSSSTQPHFSFGGSISRIRARNHRLRSMIALLMERQIHGVAGGSPPPAPSAPVHVPEVVSRTVKPEPLTSPSEESACDPNYEGACLDPNASDYDCEAGSGNGPDYTGEVRVVGEDHFGLDADGDGIGCESE
jgi:hypothetical protein